MNITTIAWLGVILLFAVIGGLLFLIDLTRTQAAHIADLRAGLLEERNSRIEERQRRLELEDQFDTQRLALVVNSRLTDANEASILVVTLAAIANGQAEAGPFDVYNRYGELILRACDTHASQLVADLTDDEEDPEPGTPWGGGHRPARNIENDTEEEDDTD